MPGKLETQNFFCKYMRFGRMSSFTAIKQVLIRLMNQASLLLGIRECRLCLSELNIAESFFCSQCIAALNEPGQLIETLPVSTRFLQPGHFAQSGEFSNSGNISQSTSLSLPGDLMEAGRLSKSLNLSKSAHTSDSQNTETALENNLEILCLSRFTYQDRPRLAVQALKYGRREELAPPLADLMLELFDIAISTAENSTCIVTAVPLHRKKMKERGFNQSELLARELASKRKLKYHDILVRHKATKAQYGLTKLERISNLADAFKAKETLNNHTVILVDDVITSGATALSCARTLIKAGAKRVIVLALCRARLRQSETSERLDREQPQFAATHLL